MTIRTQDGSQTNVAVNSGPTVGLPENSHRHLYYLELGATLPREYYLSLRVKMVSTWTFGLLGEWGSWAICA